MNIGLYNRLIESYEAKLADAKAKKAEAEAELRMMEMPGFCDARQNDSKDGADQACAAYRSSSVGTCSQCPCWRSEADYHKLVEMYRHCGALQ